MTATLPHLAFDVLLDGRDVDVAIGAAVSGMEYDLSIDSSAALTVTVRDPSRALWRSPIFDRDENGRLDRLVEVKVDGAAYRLAGVAKAGNSLTLTFEDKVVALLRSARGQIKPRAGEDHARFARRLVSLVGPYATAGIAASERELAPVDDDDDAGGSSTAAAPTTGSLYMLGDSIAFGTKPQLARKLRGWKVQGSVIGGRSTAHGLATLRRLPRSSLPDTFLIQLGTNDNVASAFTAAAKSILAILGSRRRVIWATVHRARYGPAITRALRTLAAAHSNVELWEFDKLVKAGKIKLADAVHPADYGVVAGYAASIIRGGSSSGSSPATRPAKALVQRGTTEDTNESSWDALQRISKAKGYRCFAIRNQITYAREQDLITAPIRATLSEDLPGVDWLDGEWNPNKKINACTASVRASLWALLPGSVVSLEDSGPLDGRWIVSSFRRSQSSQKASLELRRGTELLQPEPAEEVAASSSGASSTSTAAGGDEGSRSSSGVASPLKFTSVGGYTGSGHDGADLICAPNATGYAICDARVIDVRAGGWWGKNPTGNVARGDGIVQLECLVNVGPFKKGMHFGYGHAEHATVRVGQTVKAGQAICKAGFANAWHFHFMANGGGTTSGKGDRDPMPYIRYAQKHEKR